MALHPEFPTSPYAELLPDQRWFIHRVYLHSSPHVQQGYERNPPKTFAGLATSFTEYQQNATK